jgi:fluoride exporter
MRRGCDRNRPAYGVRSVHHDPRLPIDPDLERRARRRDPRVLAAVAVGGMAGSSARYGMTRWVPVHAGHFPWATFWTNVAGSFLLGVLLVVLLERLRPHPYMRPFLATGVLGAFTTMSAYQVESALLFRDGHAATGVVYAGVSLVAGLVAASVGITLGRPS